MTDCALTSLWLQPEGFGYLYISLRSSKRRTKLAGRLAVYDFQRLADDLIYKDENYPSHRRSRIYRQYLR